MDKKEDIFNYTYSAKEQSEIARIRCKYLPRQESAMERLHRLDRSVSQKAASRAIALGVIGTLVLGCGMSLVMTELGAILGAYQKYAMVIGVIIGLVGLVSVALAYPLYNRVLKKERQRIAPEILRLTDELMQ